MWSDPIDNALSNARNIIESVKRGDMKPDAPEVEWLINALDRGISAREFEKREGRLITPEDRA
jgi:hypothetical protein